MRYYFSIIIFLAVFAVFSEAYAAEQVIEAVGYYTMDSRLGETTASATERAREDAKRAAAMQAGVYIESYSKTVNLKLTDDEVCMVASRLLKIQEEKNNVEVVEDHLLKFSVKIKAVVNDIGESDLKSIMANRQALSDMTKNYKELQEKYDALNRQMEEYRKNYESAAYEDKFQIKQKVHENSENFNAVTWAQKGMEYYYEGKIKDALLAYDTAVKLNPRFAEAYNNRGVIKYSENDLSGALSDYTFAINLRPDYIDAYYNRAIVYHVLKNYISAQNDLEMVLRIDPSDLDATELYQKLRNISS